MFDDETTLRWEVYAMSSKSASGSSERAGA
jgi:hypothetical protein